MTSGWVVTVKILVKKCEEQSVGKICNIYVWNSSFLGKLYNSSDISMSPRSNFQWVHYGKVFRHRQSQYRHYLNCSRKPNLDNLKRHKLIHVPKVLHECNSCRRSFKRLDHYEKHHCMVEQQVLEENNQELIEDQELSDMSMSFLQVWVELDSSMIMEG